MLKTVLLCAIIMSALFIGVAYAQDGNETSTEPTPTPYTAGSSAFSVQSINPAGNPLLFSTYNRTIVTLHFEPSQNSTLSVATSDPNFNRGGDASRLIFFANGISTYHLHFQVLYGGLVTDQTVTLTVESGDGKDQIINLVSSNIGFTLDVILVTSVLPKYPSADEIASASNSQTQQMLEEMNRENESRQALLTYVIYGLAAAVVVIVAVVVLVIRHQRHSDQRINEMNAQGVGRGKI